MVSAGYKQTEVGVIPKDWEIVQLLEIVTKIIDNRGKTPPLTRDGEYELIETASISFVGMYPDYSKVTKTISVKTYKSWFRDHPKSEDILVSTVGEYSGASAILKADRGTIAQNLIALRITDRVEPKFIFYWSRSTIYRNQLDQVMMNQAQPSLRVPWLLRFKVLIPSKKEQTAIATALSDVDALITSLTDLIDKKRQIKTATMQQLLTGKQRLAGFGEGKGMKQTELGEIPEDWEVFPLKDLVICLDNLRVPLNDSDRLKIKGDIPYCGANGIVDWISDYILDDDIILMAEDGGYFDEYSHRPIAYRVKGKCWVNNHAHILKSKDNHSQDYIYHSLVHKNILKYLASGTRAKLNKSEMWKIELICPILRPEQQAIAQVLSDMDDDLNALENRLAKTKAIKQGMMQELLTGRIRLV